MPRENSITAITTPTSFQLISTVNKDRYSRLQQSPRLLLKSFKDCFLVLQFWPKDYRFLLRQRGNSSSARNTEIEGP
jgi:hypothetical protein